MANRLFKLTKAPVLALGLVLLAASPAAAACMNWSSAPGVIARKGLLKPGEIRKRAQKRGQEVVSINLCRRGGGYVYRLTVIGTRNRVRDVEVDARTGHINRISHKGSSRGRALSADGGSRHAGNDKGLKKRIIDRVKRNLRRHGIDIDIGIVKRKLRKYGIDY